MLVNEDISLVLEAVRTIAKDRQFMDFIIHFNKTLDSDSIDELKVLTRREKQVLKFIGQGKLTSTIAEEFRLSPSTIETHRKNIRRKLKLNGNGKLYKYALLVNIADNDILL